VTRRVDRRRRRPATLAALLMLGMVGCQREPAETLATQVMMGESHYREACVGCHQATGGLGPVLSAKVLASYGTAAALFAYLRATMPYGAPGTLDAEAYWAIVAYLVDSLRIAEPARPLDDSSAADVLLE
jgi:mono/diheme cytochrome c family protein